MIYLSTDPTLIGFRIQQWLILDGLQHNNHEVLLTKWWSLEENFMYSETNFMIQVLIIGILTPNFN